ncbi:helix-turn-helix domain-containing protein [Alginatibacterium sediminis]|uniref:Helix-turn-helix domain-containing protein n=1 Tax=Alginatibacterium sediminis TaxID=2164068 RepID=A0A420EB09_9ALTE|nr:helix-turn-helix domain-containing protein [Alginatibacterium sediminis]RKF17865.1 helix-turn-helix domain-containing protein [Alginatibacterium sediminis]
MIHLKPNEFFLDSSSAITTELRQPQSAFPEHSHSFEEIVIVTRGQGIHVVNDVPMNLNKNYVCFINHNDRHLFDSVQGLYLSNVLFQRDKINTSLNLEDYLPGPSTQASDWYIEDDAALRVNYIIERLDYESHINSLASKAISELLFQQLIVELWRGRIDDLSLLSNEDKLSSSLVYLNKNYQLPLHLESVADYVGLSPRVLSKNIKKVTGMNFSQYLHFIRAKRAVFLLIHSDKSITEIAFDVGYSDSNYFSTKFKEAINKTPRDIREQYRLKN